MNKELSVIINQQRLTEAQAMTVRVAIVSFAMDLCENGLGNDEPGKAICAAYKARLSEINKIMEI